MPEKDIFASLSQQHVWLAWLTAAWGGIVTYLGPPGNVGGDVTLSLADARYPCKVSDFKVYSGAAVALDRTGFVDTLPITYPGVIMYPDSSTVDRVWHASGMALGFPSMLITHSTNNKGTAPITQTMEAHVDVAYDLNNFPYYSYDYTNAVNLSFNQILPLTAATTGDHDVRITIDTQLTGAGSDIVNFPDLGVIIE